MSIRSFYFSRCSLSKKARYGCSSLSQQSLWRRRMVALLSLITYPYCEQSLIFCFVHFLLAKNVDYSLSEGCPALLDLRSAMLALVRAAPSIESLQVCHFFAANVPLRGVALLRCRSLIGLPRPEFFFLGVVFSSSLLSFFM